MPSDQLLAQYANSDAGLKRGEASQLIVKDSSTGTTRPVGEAIGTLAISGLNAGTYTDDIAKTFYGFPPVKPVWKVINQAWGASDALLVPVYVDQNGTPTTWGEPGTVIEDCEDDWVGTGFTSAGNKGVAVTTNKIRGTNAIELVIDGTSSAAEYIYEATGTLDLSGDSFISVWVTTDVELTAGDLAIGISTSTTFASGITEVSIPAQAAGTTRNHVIAITGIAAVESVGITMKVDPGDGTIQFDDVRMLTTAEEALYSANKITALTALNTYQTGAIEVGDRLANVTGVTVLGGTSGDDIDIRGF